jgi:tRNA pseudouridine65 synthase
VDEYQGGRVLNFEILGAGAGWLALNKPCGISAHNDQGQDLLAIAGQLLAERPELKQQTGFTSAFAPSPVHRLDRETSGVVLIATTAKAASFLGQAIENRKVKKLYRAILRGSLTEASGTWSEPLSDRAESRKNPKGAAAERKPCATAFEVISQNDYFSFVEFDLLTGRQHQIRRHAVLNRHQVVGDERYGDPRYVKQMESRYDLKRLYLHASKLVFPNPQPGEENAAEIEINCPAPADFATLMKNSSAGSGDKNVSPAGRNEK